MSNKRVNPFKLKVHLLECEIDEKDKKISDLEEQLKNATKQVRKEVCEEVYKKCELLFRLVNNYDNGDVIERNELVDILDQIENEKLI